MSALAQAAVDGGVAAVAFLAGRVLFGLVLALMGINHFAQAEQMAGYARSKGVPAAGIAVPFTGGMLVFGGLSVALGVLPVLGAGALAAFLLVTTPLLHDFWAVPEEQQQQEMTQFLKNAVLFGGALVLLAVAGADWPYALNVGL